MTMNIGIINEYFPPFAPGGAEWSSLILAQELAAKHDVRVLTPNYGAAAQEMMEQVQVQRFPFPVQLSGPKLTVQIRWLANPAFYRRVSQAILQAAKEKPFDILHAQAKYSLSGAYWAARQLNIPIAYSIRDTLIICPTGQCLLEFDPVHPRCGRIPFWWRTCQPLYMERYMQGVSRPWRIRLALLWQQAHIRLWRSALKRVDGVIGVSEGILNVYRQAGLQLGKETAVVYNLPSPSPPPPAAHVAQVKQMYHVQDTLVVLYVGKFSPGKGTQDLVAAADLIAPDNPAVQFLFAGHGDIHLNSPHTRNLGRLPHEDVLALYQLADVVVIPSVIPESFSRVGLEAMAAGKPLIGTRIGGTPEQIEDGRTGYLVPRKDPPALAQAITTLLADENKRQQMGQAAQRLIKTQFSHAASLEKTTTFYQKLITQRQQR